MQSGNQALAEAHPTRCSRPYCKMGQLPARMEDRSEIDSRSGPLRLADVVCHQERSRRSKQDLHQEPIRLATRCKENARRSTGATSRRSSRTDTVNEMPIGPGGLLQIRSVRIRYFAHVRRITPNGARVDRACAVLDSNAPRSQEIGLRATALSFVMGLTGICNAARELRFPL
jgi:hypothetical protein